MLYYFFEFLEQHYQFPGASVFQYLSFRAALAVIISLSFSLIIGKRLIVFLKKKQIGESIRDLGLTGQKEKEGTPTMGGIIIILGTLIPVLLLAKLENIYILLLILTMLWMGFVGGLDDYIKIFRKQKEGLQGKFKILGQLSLGVLVGSILFFHPDVTVRAPSKASENYIETGLEVSSKPADIKATLTTIPLIKNNEFDYHWLISWTGISAEYSWIIFLPIIIFIITAVSNGANLTDGLTV